MSEQCDCIESINDQLKEQGGNLLTMLVRDGNQFRETVAIPVLRLDNGKLETRRGHGQHFFPTYCPFCGVAYKREKGDAA